MTQPISSQKNAFTLQFLNSHIHTVNVNVSHSNYSEFIPENCDEEGTY